MSRARSIPMHARRGWYDTWSRALSAAMFALCIAFTLAILLTLVLVTWYLVSIGFKSIGPSFFTQLPIERGMAGYPGGMLHALVGSGILIGLASLAGIPLGMLAGIYLSEYAPGSFLATPVRFIADVLTGVPSIVVGIVGYELIVVPMGHHSGWAGAAALAFIMI